MSYLTGINVNDFALVPEFGLGTLGMLVTPQGTKQYKYVQLRNETAAIPTTGTALLGWPVAYLNTPANDTELNTVVSDYTDAELIPVCCGTAHWSCPGAINTSYFGWVQVRGFDTLALAFATFSGNLRIQLTTTDGVADDVALMSTPTFGIGVSSASKTMRLNCD